MAGKTNPPRIGLPRGWPRHVRSAMLHVISLGTYASAYRRALNPEVGGSDLEAIDGQRPKEGSDASASYPFLTNAGLSGRTSCGDQRSFTSKFGEFSGMCASRSWSLSWSVVTWW